MTRLKQTKNLQTSKQCWRSLKTENWAYQILILLVTPWEFGTKLKNKKRQMDPQLSLVCLDNEWKQKFTTEASPTVLPALPAPLPAIPVVPPQNVRNSKQIPFKLKKKSYRLQAINLEKVPLVTIFLVLLQVHIRELNKKSNSKKKPLLV